MTNISNMRDGDEMALRRPLELHQVSTYARRIANVMDTFAEGEPRFLPAAGVPLTGRELVHRAFGDEHAVHSLAYRYADNSLVCSCGAKKSIDTPAAHSLGLTVDEVKHAARNVSMVEVQ